MRSGFWDGYKDLGEGFMGLGWLLLHLCTSAFTQHDVKGEILAYSQEYLLIKILLLPFRFGTI